MLLNILRQTITEYNLFNNGDKVLIGLSGGADSVALTHALMRIQDELGIELFTAHLNHGIRGKEAAQDEKFAYEFSENLGIKCFVEKTDIPKLAKKLGIGEEAAARQYRYNFFERVSKENGINKIATAHNKNDNAETILMNFMRGSSLSGLSGIPYKRGNIVRPLLNVQRADIEKYCDRHNLKFVTDSTNLKNDYTRNKIRNILIPQLENDFNPNFINTVTDNVQLIREDNDYIDRNAEIAYLKTTSGNTVDIVSLLQYDKAIQRRVIRKVLKNFYGTLDGVSAQFIQDILSLMKKDSGKSINIIHKTLVKNEYGKLIITENTADDTPYFEYRLTVGKTYLIDEIKKKAVISYADERRKDGCLYLDNKGMSEITIRNKKNGDKFYPSGMKGSKKLKEYFIDNKIPKEQRKKVPIIEIDGKIAAVGKRVDEHFLFNNRGIKIEFYDI